MSPKINNKNTILLIGSGEDVSLIKSKCIEESNNIDTLNTIKLIGEGIIKTKGSLMPNLKIPNNIEDNKLTSVKGVQQETNLFTDTKPLHRLYHRHRKRRDKQTSCTNVRKEQNYT